MTIIYSQKEKSSFVSSFNIFNIFTSALDPKLYQLGFLDRGLEGLMIARYWQVEKIALHYQR